MSGHTKAAAKTISVLTAAILVAGCLPTAAGRSVTGCNEKEGVSWPSNANGMRVTRKSNTGPLDRETRSLWATADPTLPKSTEAPLSDANARTDWSVTATSTFGSATVLHLSTGSSWSKRLGGLLEPASRSTTVTASRTTIALRTLNSGLGPFALDNERPTSFARIADENGCPPEPSHTPSDATFLPVVVPTATPSPSASPEPSVAVTPSAAPSPTPKVTPKPTRKPKATAKPKPRGAIGTALIGGSATWYCCTRGYGKGEMVAAAGSELQIGNWRGRIVTVRGPRGNSIRVRLVDWCACKGNRIIDLHPAAFSMLAPLSRGVISVEVEW